MKKLILSTLLLSSVAFAVQMDAETQSGTDMTKQQGLEKSQQKAKTKEKAEETGTGKTSRQEKGFRQSEVKSINKALEKLKSQGITMEVSLPVLVYRELAIRYPDALNKTANDFYNTKLEDDGIVNLTTLEYMNSKGKIQQGNNDLKTEEVKDYMKILMGVAKQLLWQVKALNGQVFGMQDFEDIAKDMAKNIDINKREEVFKLGDKCIMVGDYQHIKCGICTLDMTLTTGIPILQCGGMEVFGGNTLLGYNIKATANTSLSFRDVESEIQNTETYKAISDAVENYVRNMEKKGISVNETMLKKLALEKATKDSNTLKTAINKMKQEEDPSKILGLLGVRK